VLLSCHKDREYNNPLASFATCLCRQRISVATAGFFSLDLGFFCFIWGSGVFIENLGVFESGQILEMYVVGC